MINVLTSRGIINQGDVFVYLKEYIKSSHKVLLVNFSFFKKFVKNKEDYELIYGNNGSYTNRIIDSFFPYGISMKNFDILHYYNDTHETALKKIKAADIIYFPGGAPDEMMDRINEFKIKEALEDKDKIFIGSSAGAMIQFNHYHITKDRDYKKFSYQEGLHLIDDYFIEVHYKKNFRYKKSQKRIFKDHQEPLIQIPDSGCVIIDDKRIFLLGGAKIISYTP
ncbi:peptidase E [Acholeplasma sp. OttesenSCG-928-E16]|nr:peptidase E [Acholeplasma sp. OttesenSCG-928-E16]